MRLFWRIFAAFWLANIAIIVALAWLTTSAFETEHIPGLGITRLQAALDDQLFRAGRELRRNGVEALKRWMAMSEDVGPVTVYALGADARDLLDRPLPRDVRSALDAHPSDAEIDAPEHVRIRALTTIDNVKYTLAARFDGSFFKRLVWRRSPLFWGHFLIAFVVSALVSLLIAWYVAAPLARIRASARRFAEGDLDARVGEIRFGRSSEVVALAREFDHMGERIEALVESHRRLVRDVSHELRSPLARLRVALELARGGDANEARVSLDRIEREADRLEAMLGQALELSRLETAAPRRLETFALDRLLEDVVTNASYEGAPQGRRVVLGEVAPVSLHGEPDALYSAVENVVRNALTYTAAGTTVEVDSRRVAEDVARIAIEVRDRGPGVAEADLARIFEPFYRTDHARTRASGGTGLGLAIAHRAIARHGGTIDARNADGGGLLVRIVLPIG